MFLIYWFSRTIDYELQWWIFKLWNVWIWIFALGIERQMFSFSFKFLEFLLFKMSLWLILDSIPNTKDVWLATKHFRKSFFFFLSSLIHDLGTSMKNLCPNVLLPKLSQRIHFVCYFFQTETHKYTLDMAYIQKKQPHRLLRES